VFARKIYTKHPLRKPSPRGEGGLHSKTDEGEHCDFFPSSPPMRRSFSPRRSLKSAPTLNNNPSTQPLTSLQAPACPRSFFLLFADCEAFVRFFFFLLRKKEEKREICIKRTFNRKIKLYAKYPSYTKKHGCEKIHCYPEDTKNEQR
jgi:hypothetical protein